MDLMIDLETLGTTANSRILSIGVTAFNPYEENNFDQLLQQTWHAVVGPQQMQTSIDTETLKWWMKQPQELAALLLEEQTVPIEEVLNYIANMVKTQGSDGRVWANSPSFDLSILSYQCNIRGVRAPWAFWAERDVRTLLDIAQIDKKTIQPKGFTPHKAEHDAAYQALLVQVAYKALRQYE